MERCANTEALNRYEREQDKAEERQSAFEQEVDEELFDKWEEMQLEFTLIAERHNMDYKSLHDYIKEAR